MPYCCVQPALSPARCIPALVASAPGIYYHVIKGYTFGGVYDRIYEIFKATCRVSHSLIQCGASVIVENERREILLQLRHDNHCWGYAGGAVEIGEPVEEAATRELFEETGLIADELRLFSVFSGEALHYVYPNGDEVYNIDIVYICRRYHGPPKASSNEREKLAFFPPKHLPESLSPPVIDPLMRYLPSKC